MIHSKPLELWIDLLIGARLYDSVFIVRTRLQSIVDGIDGWMGVPSIKDRSECFPNRKRSSGKSIGNLFLSLNL